jgi:cytochrome c5
MRFMANTNAGSKFATAKWLLILVIVVVAIVLIQNFLAHRKSASAVPQDAATTKAIEDRIKPLGEVSIAAPTHAAPPVVAGTPPETAAVASAPAASATSASTATAAVATAEPVRAQPGTANKVGEKTFNGTCTGCHSTGALGAPKLGDKAAWAPRIAQGIEVLYTSALKGKNSMPAKGGNPSLSDADVKATVDYIVAAAK